MSDPIRDVAEAAAGQDDPQVKFWLNEIDLAKKREKNWRKTAKRVTEIYEGEKKQANSFNILYSNTETLLPACYNQLPRPIVERRFKDTDPLAKQSSIAVERVLSYLMDSPAGEYDAFSSLMEQAVVGALVPGRGVTRFFYEPEFEDQAAPVGDEGEDAGNADEEEGEVEGEPEGEGKSLLPPAAGRKVVYETICGQDVDYDELLFGYSRVWSKVPWIAFCHEMTREDAEANFSAAVAAQLKYSDPAKRSEDDNKSTRGEGSEGERNQGSLPTALVYEIWSKTDKCVYFLAPEYKKQLLANPIDDPLKLSGFYPICEPLQFLLRRSSLIPTPVYTLYEEQAKELNNITKRIDRVLNAMKVRGFYDGTLQGLKELLQSDDNTLLPVKNVTALQDGKTLENSIWMMPLDKLITVFQQLLQGREACKQTIYEITGIADIMRGQGQASETATAQSIKNQWGTLKMKRMQRYVERYVRDCLRIMAELATEHFDVSTFAAMTNLDYAMPQEVAQAQQIMQVVQQAQIQQPIAPPQAPGAPGTPPAGPPPLPPQLQQAAQQAQATLQKPQWSQVMALLQNDLTRSYRIDIETNSTIEATSQEDKENVNDAMTALSSVMQSFLPAVQGGVLPMPAFRELLLTVARRFEFGRNAEEALSGMPDQLPPPPPDPKLQQAQQDIAQQQMELQGNQQKLAMDQQAFANQQKMAQETQAMQQQISDAKQQLATEKARGEMKIELEQMLMKIEQLLAKHGMDVQKMAAAAAPKPVPDTSPKVGAQVAAEQKQKQAQAKTEATNKAQHDQLVKTVTDSHQQLADLVKQLVAATLAPKTGTLTRGPDGRPSGITVAPQAQ